jgi:hypothetical protein
MDSVGDCCENALCRSFFATPDCEVLDRRRFRTQTEGRITAFDLTEHWYNPERRRSALDCDPPLPGGDVMPSWLPQAEDCPRKRGSSRETHDEPPNSLRFQVASAHEEGLDRFYGTNGGGASWTAGQGLPEHGADVAQDPPERNCLALRQDTGDRPRQRTPLSNERLGGRGRRQATEADR